MKYYIKLVMDGAFPGSPDVDTREITAEEHHTLFNKYFRRRFEEERE